MTKGATDRLSIGLYYINAYGSEIHPTPNPDYITNMSLNDVLVYSCGSLWTRYVSFTVTMMAVGT